MARTPFQVDVLTPEGEVFSGEVEMLSTRTSVGSIGILAKHTPLLAMLEPAELRLYKSETDVLRFAQAEGYLQVADSRALVLVEEAHEPGKLDVGELRQKLRVADDELSGSDKEDSEFKRKAMRDKRRWEAFIEIAEGRSPGRPGGGAKGGV